MSKSLLPLNATANKMTFDGRQIEFSADDQYSPTMCFAWWARNPYSLGNIGKQWQTSNTPMPHWWQVDLGRVFHIDTVSFYPLDDVVAVLVKDYEIQLSNDGKNFTTVHSATYTPTSSVYANTWQQELVQVNQNARYVKINILSSYDTRGYKWAALSDVDVTGRPATYLLFQNTNSSDVYGVSNGTFQLLSSNWDSLSDTDKEAIFKSVDNSVQPTDVELRALGKFKVLIYDRGENNHQIELIAVPNKQVVTPTGLIPTSSFSHLNSVTITDNTAGNGVVGVAVTTDNKNYYTYSASGWQQIQDVATQSMTVSTLNSIQKADWDSFIANANGIGFAYVLDMGATTDTANVDNIVFNVDMSGTWKRALHGTDYDYAYSNSTLTVDILTNGDYKINYPN